MPTSSIRPVTWPEIDAAWPAVVRAALHNAYYGIGEAYDGIDAVEPKVAQVAKHREVPGGRAWGAFSAEGRLVALMTTQESEGRLVVHDLFVLPTERRQGLGRRLIELAARETGCRRVEAEVSTANAASQALFRSLGFGVKLTSDWFVLEREAG